MASQTGWMGFRQARTGLPLGLLANPVGRFGFPSSRPHRSFAPKSPQTPQISTLRFPCDRSILPSHRCTTPLTYPSRAAMIFIETPVFTSEVKALLTDEEYGALQSFLSAYPRSGSVIPDTGGLRKLRWAGGGKGKRGGVRIIYYHVPTESQIWMLMVYRNGIKDDLTSGEKRLLRLMIKKWSDG